MTSLRLRRRRSCPNRWKRVGKPAMSTASTHLDVIRGRSDARDRLIEADDALARLHLRCGGEPGGIIAVPEILAWVQHARLSGQELRRAFRAFDGSEEIFGYLKVAPEKTLGNGGCDLVIEDWHAAASRAGDARFFEQRRDEIDRICAEMVARLDGDLRVLTAQSEASDLAQCMALFNAALNARSNAKPNARSNAPEPVLWSEGITLDQADDDSGPLHWRVLDGARCTVTGSKRSWRLRLFPKGPDPQKPQGFELLLVSQQPWLEADLASKDNKGKGQEGGELSLLSETLTRVLRQPIARIIANAQTIRSRLAGPLQQEYADYAGDIASAGNHLFALLDDLADLEAIESEGFSTSVTDIDLVEVTERACAILGHKAQAKNIALVQKAASNTVTARGEGRRILQILINIIGNAINYSPESSTITIDVMTQDEQGQVRVYDEGEGLSAAQQTRIFAKFERLGREGDGGSGLGLYISRRLARAMQGELSVVSEPGEGACFTLALPLLS